MSFPRKLQSRSKAECNLFWGLIINMVSPLAGVQVCDGIMACVKQTSGPPHICMCPLSCRGFFLVMHAGCNFSSPCFQESSVWWIIKELIFIREHINGLVSGGHYRNSRLLISQTNLLSFEDRKWWRRQQGRKCAASPTSYKLFTMCITNLNVLGELGSEPLGATSPSPSPPSEAWRYTLW